MTRSGNSCGAALVALALAMGACASGGAHERAPAEGFEVAHAVHEARRELEGTVLSRRHFALEGSLRVTAAAPDSATADRAIAAAFAVADSVERLLGLHHRGSEIVAINAAAGHRPVAVSPWTETVIAAALDWAERTEGAFDPTVGPVMELWGFGPREPAAFPDEARVAQARALVDWRRVRYDPDAHTVFLETAGMKLDVRAAMKGFALDRMRETMLAAGATNGILDLGGDQLFFGSGTESHRDLWPVDLQDPYDPRVAFATLEVSAGAISTTTPYARSVEVAGQRIGHLIDPRTGRPVRGLASVTVYSRDAIRSDILSTALFVMGRCDLIDEFEDIGAIIVIEPPPGQPAWVCVTRTLRDHVKDMNRPFRPFTVEDY